ncbi:MAG: T9SS type A sorting domain-containing protein [Syntrophothermus sp.]
MKKSYASVFVVFIILFNSLSAQVISQDSLALLDLYRSAKGENWKNKTNWKSNLPVGQWYGVKVENQRVVELQFGQGNNLYDTIPASIGNLTALRILDLNFNYISYVSPEINRLVMLKVLKLRSNQLAALPDNLSALASLEELDIFSNYIITIPESLGSLPKLKILNAGLNDLTDLPVSFKNLSGLRELNLSGNKFQKFPLVISSLRNLAVLILDNNFLGSIPAEVENLDSLMVLNLKEDNLSSVPAEIGSLKNLRELDLQQNQIDSIPSAIGRLLQLHILDVRYNHLKKFPDEICDLKNLNTLDAEYNFLNQLPQRFGELSGLTQLNLRFNNLSKLPAGFGGLKKLEELNLEGNLFRGSIPPELKSLNGLTLISLRSNAFTKADAGLFYNSSELQWIFLENNMLEELPDFSRNMKLTDLSVYSNNLTFEDIAPLLKLKQTHLFYTPQDSVKLAADTNSLNGFSVMLHTDNKFPGNIYTWFKDGHQIAKTDSGYIALNKGNMAEAGRFYCEITNSQVPDLVITSKIYSCSGSAVTLLSSNNNNLPGEYQLDQNYPNPFNPATLIKFSLPETANIKLKIYNIDGREVRTLLDETEQAGTRIVNWDGKNNNGQDVSSGIYVYRIESEKFTQSRRMIKIK